MINSTLPRKRLRHSFCGIILLFSLNIQAALACSPSLLHPKLSYTQVMEFQNANPLSLSFEELKTLRAALLKTKEKLKTAEEALSNLKQDKINLKQNEALILKKTDEIENQLKPANQAAFNAFNPKFNALLHQLSSTLQHLPLSMEDKYAYWVTYVDQLMRLKESWSARLIYYSSKQIICRGTGTHVMRFTQDGQLFHGELDNLALDKIEYYGKLKSPEEFTLKVNSLVRNFKLVK